MEVSPSLISEVTDALIEEVKAWQKRPLGTAVSDSVSGCLDGEDAARWPGGKPRCLRGLGIELDGHKDVLGRWTSAN
jgi:transposase-like protein